MNLFEQFVADMREIFIAPESTIAFVFVVAVVAILIYFMLEIPSRFARRVREAKERQAQERRERVGQAINELCVEKAARRHTAYTRAKERVATAQHRAPERAGIVEAVKGVRDGLRYRLDS